MVTSQTLMRDCCPAAPLPPIVYKHFSFMWGIPCWLIKETYFKVRSIFKSDTHNSHFKNSFQARAFLLACHIPDRWSRNANRIWPDLAFNFIHKRSGSEIMPPLHLSLAQKLDMSSMVQGKKKNLNLTCPMDKRGSGFTCPALKSSCPWM